MPVSRPNAITHICTAILKLQPKRVLDIGIGHGKWGMLAREYTDIWNGNYFNHQVQIHGIEIYEKYITQLQREIYDHIHFGNVALLLGDFLRFDIVIWGDCIEHLPKKVGINILEILKEYHGVSFVTTPRKFMPQGCVYGNVHETHVSHWTVEDLEPFGNVKDLNGTLLLEINNER